MYWNRLGARFDVEKQTSEVTLVQVNIKKKSRRGMGALYMRALTHELREAEASSEADEPVTPRRLQRARHKPLLPASRRRLLL